eukprot:s7405_g3.t1
MKAKTGRPTTSSHAGNTRKPSTKTKAKAKQQGGGRTEAARKTPQPTARGATTIPTLAEEDVGPLDGGSAEAAAEAGETPQPTAKDATATATHAADNDGQHDGVDWGSAEPASATPDRDTESAKSASPAGGKQLGENLEEPSPGRAAKARHACQWLCGQTWGRRDHEHQAGAQEDDQPGSLWQFIDENVKTWVKTNYMERFPTVEAQEAVVLCVAETNQVSSRFHSYEIFVAFKKMFNTHLLTMLCDTVQGSIIQFQKPFCQVLKDPLVFPQRFKDAAARTLIQGLLNRQQKKRLGVGFRAWEDIKSADFFTLGHDEVSLFDKILGRDLDPPVHPRGETYCDPSELNVTLSDNDELG